MTKAPITRVAAYGIVKRENQILMCRLSEMVPWIQGNWTLPGGGVEFGEPPVEAVVREVLEETGLTIVPRSVAGVDSYVSENEDQHYHSIRIIYHTQLIGGELRSEVNGSTDLCQWFPLEQAWQLPLVELGKVGLKLAAQVTNNPMG